MLFPTYPHIHGLEHWVKIDRVCSWVRPRKIPSPPHPSRLLLLPNPALFFSRTDCTSELPPYFLARWCRRCRAMPEPPDAFPGEERDLSAADVVVRGALGGPGVAGGALLGQGGRHRDLVLDVQPRRCGWRLWWGSRFV